MATMATTAGSHHISGQQLSDNSDNAINGWRPSAQSSAEQEDCAARFCSRVICADRLLRDQSKTAAKVIAERAAHRDPGQETNLQRHEDCA
jgi:hypothetical protein